MTDEYARGLEALTAKHNREQLDLDLAHLSEFLDLARRTSPDRTQFWQSRIDARVRAAQQARSLVSVNWIGSDPTIR